MDVPIAGGVKNNKKFMEVVYDGFFNFGERTIFCS